MSTSACGKEGIRWKRLFAEAIAIIASILLAFGIDAWWDGRGAAREERRVLESLAGEFQIAHRRLENYIGFERGTLHRVMVAEQRIHEALGAGRNVVMIPDSIVASLLTQGTFKPTLPTVAGLQGSGRMATMISDPALARALSAWPTHLEDAVEHQIQGTDYVLNHVLPTLAAAGRITQGNHKILARFGDLRPPQAGVGESEFRLSDEVIGVIGYRVVLLTVSSSELEDLRRPVDEILALLGAQTEEGLVAESASEARR